MRFESRSRLFRGWSDLGSANRDVKKMGYNVDKSEKDWTYLKITTQGQHIGEKNRQKT